MLPPGWIPSVGSKKRPRPEDEEEQKEEQKNHELLSPGTKVIVPQADVKGNKKKQKLIVQRNKQKVKRDAKRFGEGNVTTAADCEGTVEKAVKIAGVKRDLCVD